MTSPLTPHIADALIPGAVTATLPEEINADTLAAAIREGIPAFSRVTHLIALFTEVFLNGLEWFREARE